ncbi:MAG: hypothetical protein LW855_06940, partial [Alphaproteobacteria bacterium]|nr:hypothetical protein [Alphaproteobacteria bacterium]
APPPDKAPDATSYSIKARDLGGKLGITVPIEAKKAPEIDPDRIQKPWLILGTPVVTGVERCYAATPVGEGLQPYWFNTTTPHEIRESVIPDLRLDLLEWLNQPSQVQSPNLLSFGSNPKRNTQWTVIKESPYQNSAFISQNCADIYNSSVYQKERLIAERAAAAKAPIVQAPEPQQVIPQTIVQQPKQALSYDQQIAALKEAAAEGKFGALVTWHINNGGGLASVTNYGTREEKQFFQDLINQQTNALNAQAAANAERINGFNKRTTTIVNSVTPAQKPPEKQTNAAAAQPIATTAEQTPAPQTQNRKPIALLATTFSAQQDLSLALQQSGLINQAAAQRMIAALEEQGIDTSTIKKTALSIERTLLVKTTNGLVDTGLAFGDFRKAAQASTRASETAAEKPTAPKPAAAATPVRQAKPAAVSSAEPKENAPAHSLEIVHKEKPDWNQSSHAVPPKEPLEKTLALCLHKADLNCDKETVKKLSEQISQQYSTVTGLAVGKDGELQVRGTPVSPTTSTRSR